MNNINEFKLCCAYIFLYTAHIFLSIDVSPGLLNGLFSIICLTYMVWRMFSAKSHCVQSQSWDHEAVRTLQPPSAPVKKRPDQLLTSLTSNFMIFMISSQLRSASVTKDDAPLLHFKKTRKVLQLFISFQLLLQRISACVSFTSVVLE